MLPWKSALLNSSASSSTGCHVITINADRLQGVSQLPPPEKMEKTIAKQHDFNRKNFTQVERHALMVRATALRFAH